MYSYDIHISEINLVPVPYYLCVISDTNEIENFDIALMTERTKTFAKLIEKIEYPFTDKLGHSDSYSIITANSVSGKKYFTINSLIESISDIIKK